MSNQKVNNYTPDPRATIAGISAIVACVALVASFFMTHGWNYLMCTALIAQTVSFILVDNGNLYQYGASKGLLFVLVVLHLVGFFVAMHPAYPIGILLALIVWFAKD